MKDLKQNQKLEYLDVIQYGIDNIGKQTKISDIEEVFKGRTKVKDDLDNAEVLMTHHAYLGQEHLCLSFEQDNLYGAMDFDLMPDKISFKPDEQIKRLVNFKAQVFAKRFLLWRTPLIQPKIEVYLTLKKLYGLPNDFSRFNKEQKSECEGVIKSLHESLGSFGVHSKDICNWYIEKQGIYYLVSFYYFKGKKEVHPYLSFAITEMFKF